MTDFTSDVGVPRARTAPPRREYYAYFAIIFVATLPLAVLTWGLSAARQMKLPAKGPFAKAWTQARIITPQIFSA